MQQRSVRGSAARECSQPSPVRFAPGIPAFAVLSAVLLGAMGCSNPKEATTDVSADPVLEVECSAPGVSLLKTRSGVDFALEHAGKAIVEKDGFELFFLSMPGCRLEPLLPKGSTRPMTFVSATPGGDLLFDDYSDHGQRRHLLKRTGRDLASFETPAGIDPRNWDPTISDDGSSLAWIVTTSRDGELQQHLQVRDLATGSEFSIPLQPDSMGFELLGADLVKNEFVLHLYPNRVVVVDRSGATTWGPVEARAIESVSWLDFRRIGKGWIAWDVGRIDNGKSALQWSTPKGSGERTFELTRVESLSVDPGGDLIAASLSADTRLRADEALLLLRVSDGKEIFHRNLPQYSRLQVAFLDSTHLAIDARRGPGSTGGVDVVRVPSANAALRPQPPTGPTSGGKPTDADSQVRAHLSALAEHLGLKLEAPSPGTAKALVGRWKLVDLAGQQGCGGGMPFLEFLDDGSVRRVGSREVAGTFVVTDHEIRISMPETAASLGIYQMSGAYYLPSHECGLVKLDKLD